MEIFELRESIEQAETAADIHTIQKAVSLELEACYVSFNSTLMTYEHDPLQTADPLVRLVAKMQYLSKAVDELNQKLDKVP